MRRARSRRGSSECPATRCRRSAKTTRRRCGRRPASRPAVRGRTPRTFSTAACSRSTTKRTRTPPCESAYRALSGDSLPEGDWPGALHAALSRNELVFRLNEELGTPRALDELPRALEKHCGRPVTEAEVLAWLTLGAAARKNDRPLLRPVVHGFVRGIGGAVATFPEDDSGPRLSLTAEEEGDGHEPGAHHKTFPVMTCTTCGQHYYVAFLEDFSYTGRRPGGGRAGLAGSWWPIAGGGAGRQARRAARQPDRRG